jgi:hypothetical protein
MKCISFLKLKLVIRLILVYLFNLLVRFFTIILFNDTFIWLKVKPFFHWYVLIVIPSPKNTIFQSFNVFLFMKDTCIMLIKIYTPGVKVW